MIREAHQLWYGKNPKIQRHSPTVNQLIFAVISFCAFLSSISIDIFVAFYFCGLQNWGQLFKALLAFTTSLRRQLIKYIVDYIIKYAIIFCWKNVRIFCSAKDSHIFSTKNNSIFVIFTFKILTTLTKDVVNFEQPGPWTLQEQCTISLHGQFRGY